MAPERNGSETPGGTDRRAATRYYEIVRDFLKAAASAWGEAWGDANAMVTKPVTLKAMLRVAADLASIDAEPTEDRVERWRARLAPWAEQVREFRNDGFYERFPAKGQVERVAVPAVGHNTLDLSPAYLDAVRRFLLHPAKSSD